MAVIWIVCFLIYAILPFSISCDTMIWKMNGGKYRSRSICLRLWLNCQSLFFLLLRLPRQSVPVHPHMRGADEPHEKELSREFLFGEK